jgi:tetratricopeptide (TPR) repeat protein
MSHLFVFIIQRIFSENIFYYQAKSWAKLKDFNKSNELLKTCLGLAISDNAEMYYYNIAFNYESLKQYKKTVSNYDTAYYLFKNPVYEL